MTSEFTYLSKAAVKILLKLHLNNKKYYGIKLVREIDITNRTLCDNKIFLKSKGLIQTIKSGRRVYIELTPKGDQLTEEIIKLIELIS